MQAGVRSARDLTWKDGLDAFTCTECGRCKDACPTHLTGKPLSLKGVNDSLKHHLLEQREAIVADPDCGAAGARGRRDRHRDALGLHHLRLLRGGLPDRARAPRQVLPHAPAPGDDRRRVPARAEDACSRPTSRKATRGACRPTRAATGRRASACPSCARAADLAGLDYLFYVGSAMSFDPRGQSIAARLRQDPAPRPACASASSARAKARPASASAASATRCCSSSSRAALVATLAEVGATRIVTCDPHALNSLRNEYPEFGGHYEVVHHTQLIAELLADGRIASTPRPSASIYHDPCYLGRHNGEFDAPRAILARLGAAPPLEFALAREKAMCCGAGGGRMWIDETIGTRINVAAGRAGARDVAADDRDGLPLLRGDDGGRPGGAARRGHDPVARHRRAGGGRARRRSAGRRRNRPRRRPASGPEASAGSYLPEGTLRSRLPWWKRRLAG